MLPAKILPWSVAHQHDWHIYIRIPYIMCSLLKVWMCDKERKHTDTHTWKEYVFHKYDAVNDSRNSWYCRATAKRKQRKLLFLLIYIFTSKNNWQIWLTVSLLFLFINVVLRLAHFISSSVLWKFVWTWLQQQLFLSQAAVRFTRPKPSEFVTGPCGPSGGICLNLNPKKTKK